MLEIEDREQMREFEIKKLKMQVEIDTLNVVEKFHLLKLLNRRDSENGDICICMFLTVYERHVSQMKITKTKWVSYL